MKNTDLSIFTGLYPLSKTLRFELIPQGSFSIDDFIKSQSFEADVRRSEAYPIVKMIIDSYHKWFIDDSLNGIYIDWQPLRNAIDDYRKDKNESTKKTLDEVKKAIRKEINVAFKNHNDYQNLFKEDLISKLLPIWIEGSNDTDAEMKKQAVKTFHRFSTYFTGFHKNRENIYSAEEISTSVPYRITHDNFPKFLENLEVFEFIKTECPSVIEDSVRELLPYLEGIQIDDIFSLSFFNHCLSQKGIDFYNRIIGGISPENGQKLRGINEFINLYKQQHPEFAKSRRIKKMVILFKQILSDRESLSFIPELILNDKQLQVLITSFYKQNLLYYELEGRKINVCEEITSLLSHLSDFDLSKLFIKQTELTNVSQKLLGSWGELDGCLFNYAEIKFGTSEKPSNKKRIESWLKSTEFDFAELNSALQLAEKKERIEQSFNDVQILVKNIKSSYEAVQPVLKREYNEEIHLREQSDDVEKLKAFLDALQELMHRLKPLCINEDTNRDNSFYNEFDILYNQLALVIPVYNKVRNYITQKIGEENKVKLNFDNPTLANGWDVNKEDANTCVILIKDGNYYLGIMNAKNKPKFAKVKMQNGEPYYQKMVYKLLPGPNKMLPKVFFSKKGIETFNPPKFILDNYNEGKHKKGSTFDIEFCYQLIDYFKSAINQHPDWKNFGFKFSDTRTYKDISAFYKEISEQGYKLTFESFPASQIEGWINEGKLFLFQIYNKDFSAGATGRPNLHTLYWKNLFCPENLENVVLKLNGEAEFFYRDSNIKKPASHKIGEKMVNRRDINRQPIPDTIYHELFMYINNKVSNKLSKEAQVYLDKIVVKEVTHEIIKDRRFTQQKFLFHVPMTINFKADSKNENMNERVREFFKDNPTINVIGLDRGERHLIYLSVINYKGEILKQKSFNTIADTDYQEKLVQREKERDDARKSWGTIGKIKELKEGYLSQVIHEIATMMVEYNAIVVLEDLNFGFKRGRFKVERQVYQKFEKMLIDKLNYLVFKEKPSLEVGGVLKGYQLTEKFTSFKDLGKQCGFLFYVPAAYTSKIDPTTGFVNLLNLNYTNVKEAQTLFGNMDSIRYNSTTDYFEFDLNYDKFKTPQSDWRKSWTICTVGNKRFAYVTCENGQKETKSIDVTQSLKRLFDNNSIDYAHGNDLKNDICQQSSADFFKTLLWLLKLTMQMRNSNSATNEDFILSPVKNKQGEFFMSNNDSNGTLPADADANGAYHIALKGLYLLKNVFPGGSKDMKIEHKQWFEFAQKMHE